MFRRRYESIVRCLALGPWPSHQSGTRRMNGGYGWGYGGARRKGVCVVVPSMTSDDVLGLRHPPASGREGA